MRKILLIVMCMASFASAWAAPIPLPATKGARVVDTTGTLTMQQVIDLQRRSDDLDKRTGAVIITVMIPTTGEEAIDQYALRLAEAWTPGHKADERAAILVIAKTDKKVRIETSRVISTKLTDAAAGRLIRSMNDKAMGKKAGSDFYKAINIFYTEVEQYIPPKEPLVTTSVPPKSTVVAAAPVVEEDNTGYIIFGALAVFVAGFGIWLWVNAIRKKARLEEEQQQEREQADRERERARQNRSSFNSQERGSSKYATAAAAAAAASLPGRNTSTRRPYPTPPPAQRKSDDDSGSSSAALAAAAAYAAGSSSRSRSRSSDDDSGSRSSSRSSSDDSPSISFNSDSSPSSFDGGGSSGSID